MARCAVCDKDLSFAVVKYSVPDANGKHHQVCKACADQARYKALKYDPATGRMKIVGQSEVETRKRCNVCGNIFCFTPADLDRNARKESQAFMSALGSIGGALSGHYAASAIHESNSQNATDGIIDYNRCPKCGSTNLSIISDEDFIEEQSAAPQPSTPAISIADELKKFKELLDLGVITQEEFDNKKKELLNMR